MFKGDDDLLLALLVGPDALRDLLRDVGEVHNSVVEPLHGAVGSHRAAREHLGLTQVELDVCAHGVEAFVGQELSRDLHADAVGGVSEAATAVRDAAGKREADGEDGLGEGGAADAVPAVT